VGRKSTGNGWVEPSKKRYIDKEVPYDRGTMTKEAKIGKDKRNLLLIRIPRKIGEFAEISEGDRLEYFIEKPIPCKNKNDIKVIITLKRSG